jgi:hypothetical protein
MSHRQPLETVERPLMQALPRADDEYAEWHLVRVGIDYHVAVQNFFCAVPHSLIREQVDTRARTRTIEIFHCGKRVAGHARRYGGPRHGTQPEHKPSAHRCHAEWTLERLQRPARGIALNTEALIIAVARRPHPEQGFRPCLGAPRLFRGLDAPWVEAVACVGRKSARCSAPPSPRSSHTGSTDRRRRKPRTEWPGSATTSRSPLLPLGDRLGSLIPRSTSCMTSACTAW